MPNTTKNYGLKKPLPEEFYDVQVQNENMDKIDNELFKINGYGLGKTGEASTQLFPSTIDDATAAGWYGYYDESYTNLANLSFSGGILVIPAHANVYQLFFPREYGAFISNSTYAIRRRNNARVWSNWEICNPSVQVAPATVE